MSNFQTHFVTQNIVKYLTTDPITSEIAETDVENYHKALTSSIHQPFDSNLVSAVPEEEEIHVQIVVKENQDLEKKLDYVLEKNTVVENSIVKHPIVENPVSQPLNTTGEKVPPLVPPRPQNLSSSGIRYLPKDMNTKEFIEVRLPYKIEATRYNKDIGPVDQDTGVPLALNDQVDSASKKEWYRQWTKVANKRPSDEEYGK